MLRISAILFTMSMLTLAVVSGYQPDAQVLVLDQNQELQVSNRVTKTDISQPSVDANSSAVRDYDWRQNIEAFGFDPEAIAQQERLNIEFPFDDESQLKQLSAGHEILLEKMQQGEVRINAGDIEEVRQQIENQIRSIEQVRLNINNDMGSAEPYKKQFEQYAQIQLQRLRYLNQAITNQKGTDL